MGPNKRALFLWDLMTVNHRAIRLSPSPCLPLQAVKLGCLKSATLVENMVNMMSFNSCNPQYVK